MLEPYEGKLSSTVLRGEWDGNVPDLLDLTALGNSKSDNNLPVLIAYLDNSNSRLQIAAVRALGKYDNAEVTNAILDHLDAGQDEDLSTFALKCLKGRDLGKDGVTKVADILLYSNNEQVRKYTIPLLAGNKAQNPEEIKSILKQAMQTETSKANLKMLLEAYAR
ncbi:MAG: HEAT repeat domain-containing protein [Spirochaetes bacterium]|nr:HEAT repeat domain-containing protein [Spirochaetota bacterium]